MGPKTKANGHADGLTTAPAFLRGSKLGDGKLRHLVVGDEAQARDAIADDNQEISGRLFEDRHARAFLVFLGRRDLPCEDERQNALSMLLYSH
jgi:hypothetical protein